MAFFNGLLASACIGTGKASGTRHTIGRQVWLHDNDLANRRYRVGSLSEIDALRLHIVARGVWLLNLPTALECAPP